MRFSIAAVTLLGVAASASADSFFRRQDTFPGTLFFVLSHFFNGFFVENDIILACANSCTTTADFGSCQITDYHCLCTSQPFVASVTKCITTYCSGDDLQKALTLSQRLCAAVVCYTML